MQKLIVGGFNKNTLAFFLTKHWLQRGGGGWFVYSAVASKIRKQPLEKVFKTGLSKICERQPLKTFEVIWSAQTDNFTSNFLEVTFQKFSLVYSWILRLICHKRMPFHYAVSVFHGTNGLASINYQLMSTFLQ